MTMLFRHTKELEAEVDEFLDQIIHGGLLFRQGVKCFLEHRLTEFESRLQELRTVEQRGDLLRRAIESKLYLHTLIPESRGDVLGLLESADEVLNLLTSTLLRFSIEHPELPDDLNPLFGDLTDNTIATVDGMVSGCRSYFRNLAAVRDHVSKVQALREEVNRLAETYVRAVFQRDLRLSHKSQLRYFAGYTETIAEDADDVCDRLAIAAIKRYV